MTPRSIPNNPPIESRIAEILWRWKFAPHRDRDEMIADSSLASLIEFWFPFADIEFTRRRGLWCDGIPLLEVSELDRTSFCLSGVGYFPHEFSPFEIEFHFRHRRDLMPQSIVLRFGLLDHNGDLRTIGTNKDPSYTMQLRPQVNDEWAVAVELSDSK